MKKLFPILLAVFLVISTSISTSAASEEKKRYLISFNTCIDYDLINSLGGEIIREYKYIGSSLFSVEKLNY